MQDLKLPNSEYSMMELVWGKEPILSGRLVVECAQRLNWKKSTTYTVLKRLCEKGVLQNENSTIKSLIKKDALQKFDSKDIVKRRFDNSISQFFVAYMGGQGLSQREAERLKMLIEAYTDDK